MQDAGLVFSRSLSLGNGQGCSRDEHALRFGGMYVRCSGPELHVGVLRQVRSGSTLLARVGGMLSVESVLGLWA